MNQAALIHFLEDFIASMTIGTAYRRAVTPRASVGPDAGAESLAPEKGWGRSDLSPASLPVASQRLATADFGLQSST